MPEGGASRTARTTKKKKKTTTTRAKPKAKAARRGPARATSGGTLRVKQVRSEIGHAATFRRTIRALGLKYQREKVVADTPSMRGMLHKVRHLVRVTPEGA